MVGQLICNYFQQRKLLDAARSYRSWMYLFEIKGHQNFVFPLSGDIKITLKEAK